MISVRRLLPLAVFLALAAGAAAPVAARSIVDDWASVQAPPAPKLTYVTVDPKATALLMLDFLKENCAPNPRCTATLPNVAKLLAAARAAHALVIYTNFPGSKIADTLAPVKPLGHEPTFTGFLDKFEGTTLDKTLKAKHIKTVIVVGSAANGAVMYTGTDAFFHHYQTIVPVDGLSGDSAYIDQYSVFNFTSAPVMAGHIVLTSTDMIKF